MINKAETINPFESDVVTDPEKPSRTDVPRIHRRAFDLCRTAYEGVASQGRSWSILLYGEAGCGKTHLLGRFRQWLARELENPPTVPAALFVAVRMETAAGLIWRHLRRRFAEELLRQQTDGSSRLDILLKRVAAPFGGSLSEAMESIEVPGLDLNLIRVLEAYSDGRHRKLCRAWMKGEGLTETDLKTLNLADPAFDGIDEDWAEYEARGMIQALTRLCSPFPVVFCFDQLEALGLAQQSQGYGAFSRMGASLVDETSNSLILSTVSGDFFLNLEAGSSTADFQRISKDISSLQALDFELGKLLVDERLKLVPEEARKVAVPESDLRAFFESRPGRVAPRTLIHEARRLFLRWQEQPEERIPSVEEFLATQLDRFWPEGAEGTTIDSMDAVLGHGLPVALQLLGWRTEEKPTKFVDLLVDHGGTRTRIAFGNHPNAKSFVTWLKKLEMPTHNSGLCILRHAERPISMGPATQQRVHEIEAAGGRIVRVDAEALAALDAMKRLLAQAMSGDLSLGGNPVSPQTVRDWLKQNLPDPIIKFTSELLGEPAGPQELPPPDALLELLDRLKVLPVAEAVRATGLAPEKIEDYARTHPERIGYFGGACPAVCRAVPVPGPEAADGAE
jgi:hypothetical protein